jgi:hypothetical protein
MEARIVLNRECLTYHGAGVCREILRQTKPVLRRNAQLAMLHAAQELFLATRWKNIPPPELICARFYVEWRFEHVSYIFIPKLDDRLFEIYTKASKHAKHIVLLIPSDHEFLVRRAFDSERKQHISGLFTVEDYLAWRTMWAGADAGWSNHKVILWWLSRYNRFVRRQKLPVSLIVRLSDPSNAPASWRR